MFLPKASKLVIQFYLQYYLQITRIFSAESENNLQRAVNRLENKANGFNRISAIKTKTMAFKGKNHTRRKIGKESKTIEQVTSFNYLGFNVSPEKRHDH
jgi:hypothetical protein